MIEVIDATNRTISSIRDELNAEIPGERRAELTEQLGKLKDRAIELQIAYDRVWKARVMASPAQIVRTGPHTFSVVRSDGAGGGISEGVSRQGNPKRYAELEAEYIRRQEEDARVAEVAFVAWGWRGAVRIDYFGDKARVTNGGRTIMVDLAPSANS
jgi:hypothetical protein